MIGKIDDDGWNGGGRCCAIWNCSLFWKIHPQKRLKTYTPFAWVKNQHPNFRVCNISESENYLKKNTTFLGWETPKIVVDGKVITTSLVFTIFGHTYHHEHDHHHGKVLVLASHIYLLTTHHFTTFHLQLILINIQLSNSSLSLPYFTSWQ